MPPMLPESAVALLGSSNFVAVVVRKLSYGGRRLEARHRSGGGVSTLAIPVWKEIKGLELGRKRVPPS